MGINIGMKKNICIIINYIVNKYLNKILVLFKIVDVYFNNKEF
jgi:hypothetical protein